MTAMPARPDRIAVHPFDRLALAWMRTTGRPVPRARTPWLVGPMAGTEVVGGAWVEREAARIGGTTSAGPDHGLLPSFAALAGATLRPGPGRPPDRRLLRAHDALAAGPVVGVVRRRLALRLGDRGDVGAAAPAADPADAPAGRVVRDGQHRDPHLRRRTAQSSPRPGSAGCARPGTTTYSGMYGTATPARLRSAQCPGGVPAAGGLADGVPGAAGRR